MSPKSRRIGLQPKSLRRHWGDYRLSCLHFLQPIFTSVDADTLPQHWSMQYILRGEFQTSFVVLSVNICSLVRGKSLLVASLAPVSYRKADVRPGIGYQQHCCPQYPFQCQFTHSPSFAHSSPSFPFIPHLPQSSPKLDLPNCYHL